MDRLLIRLFFVPLILEVSFVFTKYFLFNNSIYCMEFTLIVNLPRLLPLRQQLDWF